LLPGSIPGFLLSPQQKYVLSLEQAGYVGQVSCTVRIDGPLDAERLRNACKRGVVPRHEILRTTYERQPGVATPFQAVRAELEPGDSASPLRLELRQESPELHFLDVSLSAAAGDSRTLRNLVAELVYCYEHGSSAGLEPAAPHQYADYAEWQRGVPETEATGVPPTLPLERRGATALVPPEAVEVRAGGLPAEFLFACWLGLLSRLADTPEVCAVLIAEGRTRPEFGPALGLYARPVPVAVRLDPEARFSETLPLVRERIAEAEQRQVHLDPALHVGFEFLGQPPVWNAAGASFRMVRESGSPYPFKLKLVCRGESCRFEYNPQLLAQEDVQRIADYFSRLIQQAATDPSTRWQDFDLLSEAERTAILDGFNQTAGDFPLDVCFPQLFEAQVERTPDGCALVFGPEALSYRQLNARANCLAHYLRSRGAAPGVRVGLFVERSADAIVALLGILKAGAAYVPLHPHLPAARLAHQLTETEARILVTEQSLLARVPAFDGHVFAMDRDRAALETQPETNPPATATAADPVYVIYTSGSTGAPKGVATVHRNVANYTQSIGRILDITGPLTFADVSTLAADLGNTPIYAALASGGCLHMIPDDVLLDGQLYGEYAQRVRIDLLKIAPSHLAALLASGEPARVLPLRHLVVGGERLTWDLVRQVRQSSACSILNHYAPTEVTIGCLTCQVESNPQLETFAEVVPLGRPIANTTVYVLDRTLRPVPVGVPGEAFIGGAGVSDGYVNRPDLTAARFLIDPIHPESGRRFYRSGDRARFLPGGFVEFLGREDDQVKIRGFRVELGEIEAVLARHPSVRGAVVVLSDQQQLAAHVVASGEPSARELREHLRQHLPDYMVPASFRFLDKFPLNANGKIDRRGLAAVAAPAGEPEAAETPSNPVVEKLIAIWKEVLGCASLGPNDNFFEMGGHSLLATLIISRVREAFQVQVPLRAIFESPTVAGLAEIIAQVQIEAQEDENARILGEIEGLTDEEARQLLGDAP
jgi:amino acid adenylation domain-containing protein